MGQQTSENVQKGTILLLVLAALALLSLLATTMASIQSVSRQESARYIEQVEAKMLAHMGFERAIAELKRDPFFVERRTWNVDLEEATHPSYYYTESPERRTRNVGLEELITREPKLISIHDPRSTLNGLQVGISGLASKGTYMEGGNVYSLKVDDLQGRIYVNDGLYSYGGNNSSVSQNLKRMLNALISHPDLFGEDPKMMELLTDTKNPTGNMLVDSRPPMGYRNIYEVLRVLQTEYGEKEGKEIFDKLEPHITTFAWVDNNVVNPAPLSHMVYDQYPVAYYRKGEASDVGISPAVNVNSGTRTYLDSENIPEGMVDGVMLFRRGRGKNATNEYMFSKEPLRWFDSTIGDDYHNAIYGLDELFPQYIEVTSRAPVNVNTASEAVLTALLTDIAGFFIMERRRYSPYSPSPKDFTINTVARFQDTELSHTATIRQKYQSWEYSSYSYDSKGYTLTVNGTEVKEDGDEFGYLYRTVPLKGLSKQETGINDPGSTLYAADIARHIVAARESKEYGGIDYSQLPFSKFDKWSNMHRFFDYLVEKQVIRDSRNIYWNYLPQGWENIDSADWSTNIRYPPDLNEQTQQTYASYAIADALKANFNPNTHLNEQNPNKNLYLRVDKTDLIVNSTEFCFTPMGYFAVESLGRILRPIKDSRSEYSRLVDSGSTNLQLYESTNSHDSTSSHESTELDVFSTPVVEVSSSKVEAVVKVFDVYRETTQAQFLRGEISNKQGPEPTNNGKGLEIGPAPWSSIVRRSRSGTSPDEAGVYDSRSTLNDSRSTFNDPRSTLNDSRSTFNDPRSTLYDLEYDGYIQLATLGGVEQVNSGPGELSTPSGSPHWPTQDIAQYEGLHVHFQFDKKAHHHASAAQLGDEFRNEVSDITLSSPKIIGKIDPALVDPGYSVIWRDKNGTDIEDIYLKNRQLRYNLSNYGKIERTENYYDDDKIQSTPVVGLYDVQRLTKSFRLPGSRVVESKSSRAVSNSRSVYSRSVDRQNKSTNLQLYKSTDLPTFSPSDLRIDGAYVERNAGLAYWIDEGISMFSYGGAVSMWIKPSFNPEFTGKTRKLFSYDRWHKANYTYRNPNMFSLLFVPAHSSPPLNDLRSTPHDPRYEGARITNKENAPTESSGGGRGIKSLRSASLFAGISMTQATGSLEDWELDSYPLRSKLWEANMAHVIDMETYYNTPSLNTKADSNSGVEINDSKFQMDMGRWTHVVWSWLIEYNTVPLLSPDSGSNITVNDDEEGEDENNDERPTFVAKAGRYEGTYSFERIERDSGSGSGTDSEKNSNDSNDSADNTRDESLDHYFVPVTANRHKLKVFVNGDEIQKGTGIYSFSRSFYMSGNRSPVFSLHSYIDMHDSSYWTGNSVRIGEASYHGFSNHEIFNMGNKMIWNRNFSGDFTVDEFNLHGSGHVLDSIRSTEVSTIESSHKEVFNYGRYYLPRGGSDEKTDSSFRSKEIYFHLSERRLVHADARKKKTRLLGASWTWYGEDYSNNYMKEIMYDYSGTGMTSSYARELHSESDPVSLYLEVYGSNGALKEELNVSGDSGFAQVTDRASKRGYYLLEEENSIKYRTAIFITGASAGQTLLLSTPVFDDVTIFYSAGVETLFYW